MSHFYSQEASARLREEARIMRDLNQYSYMPKLYACKEVVDFYLLVHSKMKDGYLKGGVSNQYIKGISMDRKLKFFRIGFEEFILFEALEIVHNDIKLDNLMA